MTVRKVWGGHLDSKGEELLGTADCEKKIKTGCFAGDSKFGISAGSEGTSHPKKEI